MKTPITLALLLLSAFVSCSQQTSPTQAQQRSIPVDPTKPHFTLTAGDLSSPAVLATNAPTTPRATIVVKLRFSPKTTEAFKDFTREHLDQQIQFIVGSNVVAEPYIKSEIPHGDVELAFSSLSDAQRIRDALNRK